MGVLFILPVLVSGFLYCTHHPEQKLRMHRYGGQFLYIQSAYFGLVLLFWSILIHLALFWLFTLPSDLFHFSLGKIYPLIIKNCLGYLVSIDSLDNTTAHQVSWLFILSVTMILLGQFIEPIFFKSKYLKSQIYQNIYPDKKYPHGSFRANIEMLMRKKFFSDSPLATILFESMRKGDELMLSMNDRKVYVGRVCGMGHPNKNTGADQEIGFIRTKSGYRDKDHLNIEFTTNYRDKAHLKNLDKRENFIIVLKQENIVSATYFEENISQVFQEPKDSPPNESTLIV
ncbi:MAG: hypothetical protein QM520_01615 [Gammaproteobacteria bacterium]|nr:hypothetical protein [Gammaproteobacteria bacterium]